MASLGLAVTSIGVYLTGSIKRRRDGFYRSGYVVVELNGRRRETDIPPYFSSENEQKRRDHFQEITKVVARAYIKACHDSAGLRAYATETLTALFNRVGLGLPYLEDERMKIPGERPEELEEIYFQTRGDPKT